MQKNGNKPSTKVLLDKIVASSTSVPTSISNINLASGIPPKYIMDTKKSATKNNASRAASNQSSYSYQEYKF